MFIVIKYYLKLNNSIKHIWNRKSIIEEYNSLNAYSSHHSRVSFKNFPNLTKLDNKE